MFNRTLEQGLCLLVSMGVNQQEDMLLHMPLRPAFCFEKVGVKSVLPKLLILQVRLL
jgi:hypothetical protein